MNKKVLKGFLCNTVIIAVAFSIVSTQMASATTISMTSVRADRVVGADPGIVKSDYESNNLSDLNYSKEFTEVNSKSFFLENIDEDFINVSTLNVFGKGGEIESDLEIHVAEGSKNENSTQVRISSLYTFPYEISKVEVKSNGNPESIELKTLNQLSEQMPLQLIQDYSVPQMTTRKKFYTNLGINIKMREEWGAPATSTWDPEIVNANKFVVHHTATTASSNPDQDVRDIYNFHYYRCGNNSGSYNSSDPGCNDLWELWQDIGYNYLITPNGQIYEGRAGGNGTIGAHSPPNSGAIGIALIGNFTSTNASTSQQQSLVKLMSALSSINDISLGWGATVFGHRDRSSTACPGTQLYNSLPTLVTLASGISSSNVRAEEIRIEADKLIDGRSTEIVKQNNDYELIVDLNGVSQSEVDSLVDRVQTTTDKKIINNKLVFTVDESYSKKLIREVKATIPNAIVQPNFIYKPEAWDNSSGTRAIPSDYDLTTHWYLDQINLPEAWKDLGGCASDSLCGGDPSVKVAIIDTGVAYEDYTYDAGGTFTQVKFAGLHQEIPTVDVQNATLNEGLDREFSQLPQLAGVNFVNPKDVYQEYMCTLRSFDSDPNNWCNSFETDKQDHANDYAGHGTYVAAIIAGKTGDAAPDKIVGIAHNVSIIPINAFTPNDTSMCQDSSGNLNTACSDTGSGFVDYRVVSTTLWVANAINHAMLYDADVINMSLGGSGYDPSMDSAIQQAFNQGIVVVASAGNNSGDVANSYPAAIPNVLTVGAVDNNNVRDYYSNVGEELEIVAPVGDSSPRLVSQTYACYSGTDIPCSDESDPNLFTTFTSTTSPISKSGTSFSSPQVAAAAALLKSKYPSASAIQIYNTLIASAKDLGSTGKDNSYGYGLLDIKKALSNLWVSPPKYSVYRFFHNQVGSHFFTVSDREKNNVQNLSNYNYEGGAFKVFTTNEIGTTPVYRFYNTANGTHFYTSSNAEKIKVQRDLPNYNFEGVSYYVYSSEQSGTTPLYRFFNTEKGFHFYTISLRERDSIINNLSSLRYEGIAYYVYP